MVPIAHYIAHVTGWLENKWVDEIKKVIECTQEVLGVHFTYI